MELKVSAFDWDDGNRGKCRKHGLSMADVEHVLISAQNRIRSRCSKLAHGRHAISPLERPARVVFSFVVFTLRLANDEIKLRPISARYMHKKEIAKYEKEIAGLRNR